jgi:gluconate 2-dehydrogenase gamma chain
LWRNTEEGFFADPIHGGNRDKIGWKLIGFPGVASADYAELVQKAERYEVEPVSILDIQEGRAKVDAQGYPKHVKLHK